MGLNQEDDSQATGACLSLQWEIVQNTSNTSCFFVFTDVCLVFVVGGVGDSVAEYLGRRI